MFNVAVYGIVDKVLFQAHTLRVGLAMSLDMNDFVHVDLLYLPQSTSGSGPTLCSAIELLPTCVVSSVQEHPMPKRTMRPPLACPIVPPSTKQGTGAKEFNVGKYLVDKTSLVASSSEKEIDQYGSMFEHVAIHQCNLSDEDYTPPNPDAGR